MHSVHENEDAVVEFLHLVFRGTVVELRNPS